MAGTIGEKGVARIRRWISSLCLNVIHNCPMLLWCCMPSRVSDTQVRALRLSLEHAGPETISRRLAITCCDSITPAKMLDYA